ncbi:MAG TPA: threonine synthase [Flavisolibacter sp.]
MNYYSTTDKNIQADFRSATLQGLSPDGGLYFPEHLAPLSPSFFQNIERYSREEIAGEVMRPFVGDTIPYSELEKILAQTIDFPFPLLPFHVNTWALELFHGPTLAFKDVGARFMSRCLGYFVRNDERETIVLVATSGDTGGAVASGFYDVPGIRVVILFPKGKVSAIQELQLTTPGKNIQALSIDGNFDDCQRMVKEAFRDEELKKHLKLTSANSINVARWLPQQIYFFLAYQQWNKSYGSPVISVPSGNFGNLCAGLLAYQRGLPVQQFIAACNANDVLGHFLETGEYLPHEAIATVSNAMDVGDPSNFTRMLHLFEGQVDTLKTILKSDSYTDTSVKAIIKKAYNDHGYTLDPHGAVAYLALETYLSGHKEQKGFFLETAHPIKFNDIVEAEINSPLPFPPSIQALLHQPAKSTEMDTEYHSLRAYLQEQV